MTISDAGQDGDDQLAEAFRVLGDPVRWHILRQLAEVDELSCAVLESTLTISKPTISYHTKLLRQMGLIVARKEGRNLHYRLQRETFRDLVDELSGLASKPLAVVDGDAERAVSPSRRRKAVRPRPSSDQVGAQVVTMLTW